MMVTVVVARVPVSFSPSFFSNFDGYRRGRLGGGKQARLFRGPSSGSGGRTRSGGEVLSELEKTAAAELAGVGDNGGSGEARGRRRLPRPLGFAGAPMNPRACDVAVVGYGV